MSELKKYDTADRLLQAGIKYDVSNPVRYKRYAIWLFSIGKKQEGLKVTEKAISMEPQKTREYITIMVLNGFSDYDILNALPERVEFIFCSQIIFSEREMTEWLKKNIFMPFNT
jgi:hypothetical protein